MIKAIQTGASQAANTSSPTPNFSLALRGGDLPAPLEALFKAYLSNTVRQETWSDFSNALRELKKYKDLKKEDIIGKKGPVESYNQAYAKYRDLLNEFIADLGAFDTDKRNNADISGRPTLSNAEILAAVNAALKNPANSKIAAALQDANVNVAALKAALSKGNASYSAYSIASQLVGENEAEGLKLINELDRKWELTDPRS